MRFLLRAACLLLLGSSLLLSCEQVKVEAPERTTFDSTLSPVVSKLTIPLSFDLDKVEGIINEKLQGTFLKKRVLVNDTDSLYFELTSLKPIALNWKAPDLRYKASLKVAGTYMKRVMGIRIQNQTPVEFEVEIELKTELGFETDWSMRPATVIERIIWTKDPILNIGIGNINLRKPVEKALQENQDGLTEKLDGFIKETVDTRRIIEKIWTDLQKPIRLKKANPAIWLLAGADSLKARWTWGPEREITVQAQLTARIQTLVEGDNLDIVPVPLPPFSIQTDKQDSLIANVLCRLPFDIANQYIREGLVGTKIDTAGYQAEIRDVEVYGTDDGLAVRLSLKGDLKGDIYFRGKPVINSQTKSLIIEDFDFDVDSENAIVSSADWLLHSSIKDLVEAQLDFELQPFADLIPTLITSGIEKGKLGEKIQVDIQSWRISPVATIITASDIQMIVQVRGMAGIQLQQIQKDSTAQNPPGK